MRGRVAAGCFVAAGLICIIGILGWALDVPVMRSPLPGFAAAWPPALATNLLLAATLLALSVRNRDWVPPTRAGAVGIAVTLLALQLLALSLFTDIGGSPVSCMLILLLGVATIILFRNDREGAPIAALVAALVISFALLLLAGQILATEVRGGLVQPWHIPILTNVAELLLGVGLLLTATDRALSGYQAGSDEEWPMPLRAVPALMVAPALVLAVDLVFFGDRDFPESAEIWGMLANTLIVGSVLLWAIARLTRQRSTLRIYAQTLDAQPIAMLDADGRIIHWSKGCEALYGFTEDEAIGRIKTDLLHSRAAEGADAGATPDPGAGAWPQRRLVQITRDGRELQVLEHEQQVEDRLRGSVTVLSATDLSPLLRAESATAESDVRLLLAAEAHKIGIFEWEVATGKLNWFADTEPLLGLPSGTLGDYDSWQQAILPEDRDLFAKRLDAAVWAKADQISFFYRLRLPDGLVRAIEGSARCFYDDDGHLARIVGVNIDVTDRVQQTTQLAAREAQMRSILETVPSAMLVIDIHGRILSFSPAAERLFGHAANDVIGSNVSILMNDDFGLRHNSFLERYLCTGERRIIGRPRILTALHADGSEFPIELHVGEAVYEDNRVFTGFITDLSERLRGEERLEQLANELTQIGRINAMGELAAALAHEINQPLAAIANHIATAEVILESDEVPDPIYERLLAQLCTTREQTLRAGEIIRRLRDFVSRRDVDLRVEAVETAIREASALVLVGTQRLDVSVAYDLAPEAPYMFADKIQIQQVLVNLMRNALEALRATAADQRSIRVATRKLDGDRIEFSVSDNGPGLAKPILEQMFLPFNSTKGEGSMGIGLLICRRIVEAHGGTMSAQNNDQGGATFRFTVPGIERSLGEE
ncbi:MULTISPECIES: PAS domain S-box protein [unclassified Sphingomonas]|uniref:PAS domain S-box protein n=1 Tax=unclassified Sphingomonas TaxID=196159 RepID=UPI002150A1D6|nr:MULTISPECIES: PAS domain S-box protein [unclassified Sphingomonas]MCR5869312.1 PAS domain S-box protein [Sphingomonas sp. J344]UUX98955.1 PAS domain S-box protein [Sphingomonas sp. J315]